MNYNEAIDFIQNRLRLGTKLGLETTTELLRRVGNPHKKLKFIHIAGTNGKGSTSAFIANILIENGYKTGMYISPYVNSFTERIQVNNKQIPKEDLARHAEKIKNVIDDTLCPTEFEIVTAIGFLHFLQEKCDYVVLEVGLGGRFDATNVIPPPAVTVITSISIDHTELLGNTIKQIAFEKCGIIKPHSPVAVYPDNPPEALEVIQNSAKSKNAPLTVGDKNAIRITHTSIEKTDFTYMGDKYRIHMLGEHQVYNAVTAITAVRLAGINKHIAEGLEKTIFKGRLEIVRKSPLTIIDGAHNYSGMSALKNALQSYFGGRKIILVMGMLRDKEFEKCTALIAPMCHLFIATEADNPRTLTAGELLRVAKKHISNAIAIKDKQAAVDAALSYAGEKDVICVCGSLYLIGGLNF
jgi:dihydrofolate synthase/folylpolyglutamate synthase